MDLRTKWVLDDLLQIAKAWAIAVVCVAAMVALCLFVWRNGYSQGVSEGLTLCSED